MLAKLAPANPQDAVEAISRTSFVAAKFTPEICSVHPVVRVHCVVPVSAPFIVNAPTLYNQSACVDGSWAQHKEYRSMPAVAAVTVPILKTLNGWLAELVVTGFVRPVIDCKT
jgi:hypothetical protein